MTHKKKKQSTGNCSPGSANETRHAKGQKQRANVPKRQELLDNYRRGKNGKMGGIAGALLNTGTTQWY